MNKTDHPNGILYFNKLRLWCRKSRDIAIYHRWGTEEEGQLECFIIVFNISGYDQHVIVPFSTNGIWQDLLNESEYLVGNYQMLHQLINSNWGKVFYRKESE